MGLILHTRKKAQGRCGAITEVDAGFCACVELLFLLLRWSALALAHLQFPTFLPATTAKSQGYDMSLDAAFLLSKIRFRRDAAGYIA